MSWDEHIQEIDRISGDRRCDRRYRIDLELRWKLIRRRKVRDTGTGHTVDMSSGGILFDATRPLPTGMNVELFITWPVLLHNVAPLQLVISGRIIRTSGSLAAVQMVQHEFRTAGVPNEHRDVLAVASRTPPPLPGRNVGGLGKVQ